MRRKTFVNFEKVNIYRKHLGDNLFKTALNYIENPPKIILEIGPSMESPVINYVTKKSTHQIKVIFIEPNKIVSQKLAKRVPTATIYTNTFENIYNHLKNQKFDLIYANFSLHWIADISESIKNLVKLLKKNGLLAMTVTDPSRSFWQKINRRFIVQFPNNSLFNIEKTHDLTVDDWQELFLQNKLKNIVSLNIRGVAAVFSSRQHLLREFKLATGSRYLKRNHNVPIKIYEDWILKELQKYTNKTGKIFLPASAFQCIWIK